MVALSADRVLVAYKDAGNSNQGTVRVGEVSGTGITWGGELVFNNASLEYVDAAALSSDQAVVVYRDHGNSNYGTAVVCEVSGTSVTCGSESVFNGAAISFCSVAALASDRFAVVYADGGGYAWHGRARVGQTTGTAVASWGGESTFNGAYTQYCSVMALADDRFAVAYRDGGNSDQGTVRACSVLGTAIDSWGGESVFNSASTKEISMAPLSTDELVVTYRDEGNSGRGTSRIVTVTGATIGGWGDESVFNTGSTYDSSVATLTPGKFIAAYRDSGNSSRGTAYVMRASNAPLLGIADADGTAGQVIPVIVDGVSDVHTGLTPWDVYYAGADGRIAVDDGGPWDGIKLGRALSETELLLTIDR